jgi:chromate transport protein ChrA
MLFIIFTGENMLNKIFKFLKRIIITIFLLYGYNVLMEPLKLIIPINFITVLSISIFGLPALLSFIIILICGY